MRDLVKTHIHIRPMVVELVETYHIDELLPVLLQSIRFRVRLIVLNLNLLPFYH